MLIESFTYFKATLGNCLQFAFGFFYCLIQLIAVPFYAVDKVLDELVSRYLSHEFNEEVSKDHEGRMIIYFVLSPDESGFFLKTSNLVD